MKLTHFVLAPAALLAVVAACARVVPVTPASLAESEIILKDGDEVSGLLEAWVIRVLPAAVVWVTDDLQMRSSDTIEIRGTLRADSRLPGDPQADAPNIDLEAGQRITVAGAIEGGTGRRYLDDPWVHGG